MKNRIWLKTSFCFIAPLLLTNVAYADTKEVTVAENSNTNVEGSSNITNKEKIQFMLMTEDDSVFSKLGISVAENYVHIRKEPTIESNILGKLYEGSAAIVEEIQGDWVKVKSGSVEGYISADYLVVGDEAKQLISEYALEFATVNTITLRVREESNMDSRTLALLPEGATYSVLAQADDWVKIEFEGHQGYVSKEYVNLSYEFENAVSIEEEQQRLAAEEEASQREVSERKQSTAKTANRTGNQAKQEESVSASVGVSGGTVGSKIVSYAKKFVGNPYVWGGTSLTSGADCSGFVQSVFKNFGYNLPRTSRQQAKVGSSVSVNNMKVGDLIFYASGGSINHVAIYIGSGKVVHASNPKEGIKISSYNYRTPYKVQRVLR